MLCEGQEKDDFWNLLGGKAEYSTSPRLAAVSCNFSVAVDIEISIAYI